jgi:hypothetical protein
MKRFLTIAVILEILKYLLVILSVLIIESNNQPGRFIEPVLGWVFFFWFLPETMIGGENPPHHWYTILARLCAGVVWNFPVALYFSSLFPEKISESDATEPFSKPEKHLDI